MIIHVDMDAFFASVEQRDHPELKGRPVVVGGNSRRSVVSTASYEARQFSIHSAMPMYQALEKCPDLIVIPGDKKKYARVSRQIMALFHRFTPLVDPISIDEAFLDITGCQRIFGSPETMAGLIKQRINEELSLTCSLGVAPLRFLAKIASDMNKPDGITIIPQEKARQFALDVAVEKVPGVGSVAMKQMRLLGIRKLGDILSLDRKIIANKFGRLGEKLVAFASCREEKQAETKETNRSISSEATLDWDTSDMETIKQQLLAHSQTVGREVRKQKLFAATVFIKFKFNDFSQTTRQTRVDPPVCSSRMIFHHALLLAAKTKKEKKVRLLGVGVSSFTSRKDPVQADLFTPNDPEPDKWETIDKTVDAISDKFGSSSVKKAGLFTDTTAIKP